MYSIKPLIQGSLLTNTAAVYYTAPTGTNTRIGQMSITNTDSVPHTVTVYLADNASAPTAADVILPSKTLQANESFVVFQALGAVVTAGGTIQAIADASGFVTLKASGTEFTQ